MTAEYLDKSDLVARMEYYEKHTTKESGEHYAYSVALREIRNAPAADVTQVVRCRDCKHSYEDLGGLYCSYGPCVDCPVSPDFWCANGKRREDAHAQD